MLGVSVNWWAVLAAAAAYMAIGALWYGPLLGGMWKRLVGFSDQDARAAKMSSRRSMFLIFVFALVTAYALAYFVYVWGAFTLTDAWWLAFWLWLGFVATTQAGAILSEDRSWKLFAVSTVASLLSLWAMASILVRWG